jgi:hypothetical protein
LDGVEHHTDKDEQRSSTEEVGKGLMHLEGLHLSEGGENGDYRNEERTGKREV